MFILKAKHTFKISRIFDVTNLFPLVTRKDQNYIDYKKDMFNSLNNEGMLYPILCIEKNNYWRKNSWYLNKPYGVVAGNKRYNYAVLNNYTHIEGILCKDRNEYIKIWKEILILYNKNKVHKK